MDCERWIVAVVKLAVPSVEALLNAEMNRYVARWGTPTTCVISFTNTKPQMLQCTLWHNHRRLWSNTDQVDSASLTNTIHLLRLSVEKIVGCPHASLTMRRIHAVVRNRLFAELVLCNGRRRRCVRLPPELINYIYAEFYRE